jgi:hypothetical protein
MRAKLAQRLANRRACLMCSMAHSNNGQAVKEVAGTAALIIVVRQPSTAHSEVPVLRSRALPTCSYVGFSTWPPAYPDTTLSTPRSSW